VLLAAECNLADHNITKKLGEFSARVRTIVDQKSTETSWRTLNHNKTVALCISFLVYGMHSRDTTTLIDLL